MWCKVLSCIGKMTLAKPKGFLLLKPSALHQPPSAPLPSPNCVFRPAMKHSDRAAARGFKLSPCTLGGGQDPAKGEAGERWWWWWLAYFHSYLWVFPSVCKPQSTPAALIQAKSNPSGVRPLGAKHADRQTDRRRE